MSYDRPDLHRHAAEAERRDRDRRTLGADVTATPRQRRWLVRGLVALAVLGTIGLGYVVTSDPAPASEARPLDRVQVEGDGLLLHWSGTACEAANLGRTEVTEASDQVKVTLFVDTPIQFCEGGSVAHVTEVALNRPLADRDVVDGACLLLGFVTDPLCERRTVPLD